MAGKSFRGVGDEKAPSRRTEPDGAPRYEDEDDPRGVHSGPTVVDDAKVAEVLKKLRSLDQPPGPLTGVTEVVVDANSSEKTQIDSGPIVVDAAPAMRSDSGPASLEEIMYPLRRATAIGRSLSPTTGEQPITIPADAGRGTLFGRSIHLPDVNAPDEAVVEISSGSVEYADGSPSAPQPFPLADRLVAAAAAPPVQSLRAAVPRSREEPSYGSGPTTDLISARRSQAFARVVALLGGVAVVGVVWLAVTNLRSKPAPENSPPAQATAAQQATVAQPPAAAPRAPSVVPLPSPAPATAIPPAAEPVAAPANAAAAPAGDPAPAVVTDTPPTTRRAMPAPERRPARLSAPLDDPTPPPSKSSRSRRRAVVPEDPDATLPPSM